jgi:hypothetical protein
MKKMTPVLMMIMTFLMSNISISSAQNKDEKIIETVGVKVVNTRGADTNINLTRPIIDDTVPKPKAVSPKECTVSIVNETGYYIDIYVDNRYAGTIGPWENREKWVTLWIDLFAKSIGGSMTWGPIKSQCDRIWKLTEKSSNKKY